MSKHTFATLFNNIQNIHLIKDPGMIPLTFDREFGYKSVIPIFEGRDYPYRDIYYQNIEMPIFRDNKIEFFRDIERTKWLLKNANRVDVLNLFFFYRGTWFLMWLYKKLNPNGLIYIHVDTDGKRLIDFNYSKNPIKRFITKKIFLKDSVINDTLWGIQNSVNAKKLEGVWPFVNIKYIPNGVHWENNLKPRYEDKENIILTVARVGSPEKNNDKLIECFKELSDEFPSWRLRLVGPIEESFKPFLNDFFEKNPQMKNRIELPGAIYDRNELEKEYMKAKVFCLPSSWEGFSLVGVEALSKGCFILGSCIDSNIEVTQNETMGMLFENENWQDLTEKMRCTLLNERLLSDSFEIAVKYANEHFTWKKALEPVDKWAKEKWRRNE